MIDYSGYSPRRRRRGRHSKNPRVHAKTIQIRHTSVLRDTISSPLTIYVLVGERHYTRSSFLFLWNRFVDGETFIAQFVPIYVGFLLTPKSIVNRRPQTIPSAIRNSFSTKITEFQRKQSPPTIILPSIFRNPSWRRSLSSIP